MNVSLSTTTPAACSKRGAVLALVATGSVFLAACSADITRFSGPGFNLNGTDDQASLLPPESLNGGATTLSQQTPPASYSSSRSANIETSALPSATPRADSASAAETERYAAPRDTQPRIVNAGARKTSPRNKTSPRKTRLAAASGRTITVQSGDTLYGLSRRHDVSVAQLMTVNGLDNSLLRVGQTLKLPSGATGGRPRATKTSLAASKTTPRRAVADASLDTPATWNGSYEVQPGDSLYRVARQYGVTTRDLQRYNGITDPRRVMPGTTLRVPGGGRSADTRVAALPRETRTDAVTQPSSRGVRTVTIKPPKISKPAKTSPPRTETALNLPSSSRPTSGDKLRWPVRGKVIETFGRRADGTHNDGVNFAVPVGTDVSAADEGVVAYAGSELRSYGNLILLRHDNGWVTAYAHNDKLLVKRGDKVKRGQVIAKSGQSGQVDRPQLHFELRQSSKKPVDPVPYFEKL